MYTGRSLTNISIEKPTSTPWRARQRGAISGRVSRIVASAITTVLSMSATAYSQAPVASSAKAVVDRPVAEPTVKRKAAGTFSHLYGMVTDTNSAAVIAATVTVTNKQTMQVHPLKTDEEGNFRVLLSGDYSYELRVEYPGFLNFVRDEINMRLGGDTRWDVTLRVGPMGNRESVIQYQQPLIRAVQDEYHHQVVDLLRRGADVNKAEDDGTTPLQVAIIRENEDTIRLLIKAGANLNAVNDRGENILFFIDDDDDDDLIEMVIGFGADANQVNQDGNTPLLRMADWDEEDRVQLIIDAGAKVNVQNHEGNTALMIAASHGNNSVAKVLLDAGADPNLRNADGKTALDLARLSEEVWTIELLEAAVAEPIRIAPVKPKPKVPPVDLPENENPPAEPEE
jgi:hypothetical protein